MTGWQRFAKMRWLLLGAAALWLGAYWSLVRFPDPRSSPFSIRTTALDDRTGDIVHDEIRFEPNLFVHVRVAVGKELIEIEIAAGFDRRQFDETANYLVQQEFENGGLPSSPNPATQSALDAAYLAYIDETHRVEITSRLEQLAWAVGLLAIPSLLILCWRSRAA